LSWLLVPGSRRSILKFFLYLGWVKHLPMQLKLVAVLLFLIFASIARGQTPVIDSLQKIIAQNKKDSVEVLAYLGITDQYARNNIPVAKRYAYNALTLSRELNLPVQLSAAYSELTVINAQTNQNDSAKYYLGRLKKLAGEYKAIIIQSNYNSTAGLFYRKQGNYKASLPYMLEALRITKLGNNKTGVAGQTLNVGNTYLDMGKYRDAMAYHLEALKLFEALGNKRGMSFCYGEVGDDFTKLDQFTAAIPYIQRSLALKNELNDKKGIATAYVNLGEIEEGLKHPDKALPDYLEALALNQTLMLPIEEAKCDLYIGKLYAEGKDITNANGYFSRSGDLFKKLRDTVFLAVVNAEEASLQKNFIHRQKAEKTFLNTLSSSIKMGDKNTEVSNYRYLSDFYEQNKQYDKALLYNKKYHDKRDSLQNKQLQLQVKDLEQRYNLEKQEKEISLLKKDQLLDRANIENQKIFRYGAFLVILMLVTIGFLVMTRFRTVQKTRRLLELEKMRNSIARNLHDDVGSTLSSINILSNVALKQLEGNTMVSNDLKIIKDSSFSIMESMSDIVWAINPVNDSFEKTILKMKGFASAILEPAGISFDFREDGKLSGLKLSLDERKNLYLIFKEAVNNVAKYSEATTTEIILQKSQHQFLMKITDNGKGFDNAKEFEGNGLKNMKSRAVEMGAFFEINSGSAKGASVLVSVAIP
jgi:two-component system sensor histidine kinase UhpB